LHDEHVDDYQELLLLHAMNALMTYKHMMIVASAQRACEWPTRATMHNEGIDDLQA
jgi:hypothetical protein